MNSLIFEDTNLGGTPYRFAACEARDGVMIACHKAGRSSRDYRLSPKNVVELRNWLTDWLEKRVSPAHDDKLSELKQQAYIARTPYLVHGETVGDPCDNLNWAVDEIERLRTQLAEKKKKRVIRKKKRDDQPLFKKKRRKL